MSSEKPASERAVYFKGSCACGRITYDSTAPSLNAQNCHCITCQKISGAPYQAFADVKSSAITLYDNVERLRYEGLPKDSIGGITFIRLSKSGERAFCASCHGALAMRYKHDDDFLGVTLGSVDGQSVKDEKTRRLLTPQMHIFVSQKAWWIDTTNDGLPCHERFSGDFEEKMKVWEGKEG